MKKLTRKQLFKKLQPTRKEIRKRLDILWADIIKLRAGYESEISGGTENLQAHHIAKKPCDFLRYDLDNGICLTSSEHVWGIHGKDEEEYRERIKLIRGQDIYEKLRMRRNNTCDLRLIEMYLRKKLEELKNI